MAARKLSKKQEKARELQQIANTLIKGARVLQETGANAPIANAISSKELVRTVGSELASAAADVSGSVVTINIGHPVWQETPTFRAQRAIGHESLHTIGLLDQPVNSPIKAYQYGPEASRKLFQKLKGTPLALINPDNIMDWVY